jgi:tetraacyldisaccharide 4'-kinase
MPGASGLLEAQWARRGALSTLVLPLSWLFAGIAGVRRLCYRRAILRPERFAVPVIVVGNLTVGGSGKTPLVIAIVELLRAHGWHPGVVSRGYGGRHSRRGASARLVHSDDAALYGDEVVLIRRRTGVAIAVGRARGAAVTALLAAEPDVDVVISDDGLQHYALARDIELVVFDERGVGNGRLLPAGPLREPVRRARSATALVLNGTAAPPPELLDAPRHFAMRLVPGSAYALSDPALSRPLAALPGPRILAAAGIGFPARFFSMLAACGVHCQSLALPDHFDFAVSPFKAVAADCILVTEKDAVKCAHLADSRIWVVPVDARLDDGFPSFLLEALRACSATRSAPA